jgi:hypothetical protein
MLIINLTRIARMLKNFTGNSTGKQMRKWGVSVRRMRY